MTNDKASPPKSAAPDAKPADRRLRDEKESRRAAALRANLRRRKAAEGPEDGAG